MAYNMGGGLNMDDKKRSQALEQALKSIEKEYAQFGLIK